MAKSVLEEAETYLFRDSSWVGGKNDNDAVTNGDLFQTTELMFLAYLCTAEDTARQLRDNKLGRIHHRLLYVAVKKPGKTVGEVLSFLRVTNQNIHRPLGDLVEQGFVEQRTSAADRRKRELHATKKGEEMFEELMRLQYARFQNAYETVGKSAVRDFWRVLWCILDESDREWLLRDREN